jgi:hypothetical protein
MKAKKLRTSWISSRLFAFIWKDWMGAPSITGKRRQSNIGWFGARDDGSRETWLQLSQNTWKGR